MSFFPVVYIPQKSLRPFLFTHSFHKALPFQTLFFSFSGRHLLPLTPPSSSFLHSFFSPSWTLAALLSPVISCTHPFHNALPFQGFSFNSPAVTCSFLWPPTSYPHTGHLGYPCYSGHLSSCILLTYPYHCQGLSFNSLPVNAPSDFTIFFTTTIQFSSFFSKNVHGKEDSHNDLILYHSRICLVES